MSKINEKLRLRPAGRRSMMKLPTNRAASAALTSARCPKCQRTGVRENVIHGRRCRMCEWCGECWDAE